MALAMITSSALGQSTIGIPPQTSTYDGVSRGFSCVSPTDFEITELEIPGTAYQAGDTASFRIEVDGMTAFSSIGGNTSNIVLPVPLPISTGQTFVVIGHWSGSPASQYTAHNSYGASAPYATTINGVAAQLDRAGVQWDIGDPTGSAGLTTFSGIAGLIGRCIVTVQPPSGTPAEANVTGSGCGANGLASFYEVQDAGINDLQGQKITGTKNLVGGYDITIAPGAGFAVPSGSINTNLGDDTQTVAGALGTLGMVVGSNGWMALGAGNSNGYSPNINSFLVNPSEGVYAWTDLQTSAAGSGSIYYSESGTIATATYEGVYGWGTTDPNNIKLEYDTSNGDWSIEFETTAATNPQNWLIGYSTAADQGDGGSIDISAAAPFSTAPFDTFNLSLEAIGRPVQGAASVPFRAITTGMPATTISHLSILGFTGVNLPLDAIGMPGCTLYADTSVLDLAIIAGGGSYTWDVLTLPPGSSLVGITFEVQSAIFGTDVNNFINLGALTSNSLSCVIGDT